MSIDLEAVCIGKQRTLADAARNIDASGAGIALIVDKERRLLGTFTDGDLRRALLAGARFDDPVSAHVQSKFTSVPPQAGRAEVLDIMQARLMRQIPIVDPAAGHLVGLHLMHEVIGATPRPNLAVIMAGGRGTRLAPITEHIPKPMVTVAGRPILERLVLHLVSYGIRRIFLSVNHLAHVIEDHFGDGTQFGCKIEYLREQAPLGTGGALSLLPTPPTHPLLVMNGDLITQADIDGLLSFHGHGRFVLTVAVRSYVHQVPYGCVDVRDAQVVGLEEKPTIERLVNAGIYVIEPQLLPRIPPQEFPITTLIKNCLAQDEPVGSFEITDDWIDIGQRETLNLARRGRPSK